jgi:3-hydroxyacyl-CoA dehydrogenase
MKVAVIGTGTIGASWTSWFLARGLDVVATDPQPDAEAALRRAVDAHWPVLSRMGLAPGATPDRLRWASSIEATVDGADFVQENGPERLAAKHDIFRRMDAAAPADTILASSSSTLMPSDMQATCARPGRVVLGHPFNPPHLIPLVEVVGGRLTDPEAVDRAIAFYREVGKHPIRLKREINGHIANRLQAALWREAFHLLLEDVADVADIDAAIAHGPGLRWALLGPFLNLHLSGGAGGMRHMLDHLGPPIAGMWADLGTPEMTDSVKAAVIAGTDAELSTLDPAAMVAARDAVLTALLALKQDATALP